MSVGRNLNDSITYPLPNISFFQPNDCTPPRCMIASEACSQSHHSNHHVNWKEYTC